MGRSRGLRFLCMITPAFIGFTLYNSANCTSREAGRSAVAAMIGSFPSPVSALLAAYCRVETHSGICPIICAQGDTCRYGGWRDT